MLVGCLVADCEGFCRVVDLKLQLVLIVQVDDVVCGSLWAPFGTLLELVLLRLAVFIESCSFFP